MNKRNLSVSFTRNDGKVDNFGFNSAGIPLNKIATRNHKRDIRNLINMPQPRPQQMNQPMFQQMPQPMNQPMFQQMQQQMFQPMNQPMFQPMNQPMFQPRPQPMYQPMQQSMYQPMYQQLYQPMYQPRPQLPSVGTLLKDLGEFDRLNQTGQFNIPACLSIDALINHPQETDDNTSPSQPNGEQ